MLVLDTDILVDALNGNAAARAFFEHHTAHGTNLVTTSVNVAEVWRGAAHARDPRQRAAAEDLLGGLRQLPFGPSAAARFGELMAELDAKGTPMPVADGMIAAIAVEASAPLVTRNKRHFDRVATLVTVAPDQRRPTQT